MAVIRSLANVASENTSRHHSYDESSSAIAVYFAEQCSFICNITSATRRTRGLHWRDCCSDSLFVNISGNHLTFLRHSIVRLLFHLASNCFSSCDGIRLLYFSGAHLPENLLTRSWRPQLRSMLSPRKVVTRYYQHPLPQSATARHFGWRDTISVNGGLAATNTSALFAVIAAAIRGIRT